MRAESFGVWVAFSAALCLAVSLALEQCMQPRPRLRRPVAAWFLHAGVCLCAHALLTLLLLRPGFAAAVVSACMLVLVLVNNAKMKALREPFVFQDFEYFTDAIRYPRLYIPFFGWGKFFLSTLGFVLAVAVGLWLEPAPQGGWMSSNLCWPCLMEGGVAASLLWFGLRTDLRASFEASEDLSRLGLLTGFALYARAEREPLRISSVFARLFEEAHVKKNANQAGKTEKHLLPHLVSVQSESFFDPRSLIPGIRTEVLAEFDRLKESASFFGKLQVPAWGANTVRSEFAFLTGVPASDLGVHRFNPYRALAAGSEIFSLAHFFKKQGYWTICVHPYPAGFYQRHKVFPRLGFDEFLDIQAFTGADRFGPYVSDAAVGEKVSALLQDESKPLFIHVITMENHGPLHLESVSPSDVAALYEIPPPQGCEDLTVYLRHLRHADHMVRQLRDALERCVRPATLCWFGDHVPIMPQVYQHFAAPDGDVDYVVWRNRKSVADPAPKPVEIPLSLERLGGICAGVF